MAVDWIPYRTGMRAVINIVWPEVGRNLGGGGIFTLARLQQVNFDDLRNDDEITTTAVLQPATYRRSEQFSGLTNQAYEILTRFHYVRRRDSTTDMEEFVEGRLSALAEYLLYETLPAGQCLQVVGLDALEGNAINAVLLEKNREYYGGTLTAVMLTGHGVG